MGLKTLLLLSLLAALELPLAAFGGRAGGSMPGSPSNVSRNDRGLQQVVLAAAYSFNNQSNDAFLFKPSLILRAQRQVVRGVKYIVDWKISRTVCRKREDGNLSNCDFQPAGRLHQTFACHTEVWLIPWLNQTKTLQFHCGP
ncbi:cystatin-F [Sander lucioperca]|uniref:cystatin-F n=1 Tax=Sander lucioperca TaxID=283035 RepID=UPI001653AD9E|nr:cystatin-F [Sander lucioperca]